MKRKLCLFLVSCFLLLAGCQLKQISSQDEMKETAAFNNTYWIITDPHYLAEGLRDEGEAFAFIEKTAAGKDLRYQKEGLQAFVDLALTEKPNGIIITGDLTLNGEKASAEELAKLFNPLLEQKISIYVVPGNHDIFDGWARSYQGDDQEKVAQISPADFKDIFADMGYQKDHEQDPNSLSYKVRLNSQLDFYFLDTNKYGRAEATRSPITAGSLKKESLTWLEKQLKETCEEEKQALIFMHHNLYQHNSLVYEGYVIDDSKALTELFQKYQVAAVFSGHIHAQDIAVEEGEAGNLPEIVTSSFAITPKAFGVLTVTDSQWQYQREKLDVSAWANQQVKTESDLLNYNQYVENLFLKDGRQMAYRSLFEAGLADNQETDQAAELVSRLNRDFFVGEDNRTDEEVAEIKESAAYQTIQKSSDFLASYLDSIIQDQNTDDLHYQAKWPKLKE